MAVKIEPIAGLAVGKLVKFILKKVGAPEYKIVGVDVVKLGIGAALTGVSYYYGEKLGRFEDVVGFAGAGMIIDELAKAAGINPGEKTKTVVVESKPITRSNPRSVIVA